MPIPGPEMINESRLNNAINEVSKEVLVTLAQTLCKENTSAKEFFEKNLFVSEDQVPQPDAVYGQFVANEFRNIPSIARISGQYRLR